MDIIKTLGIDSTVFVQLILFLIAYLASTKLVFEPYLKILNERKKRTVGSQEEVNHILAQTDQIGGKYEAHARHVNDKIKEIFDKARMDANKRYDTIVTAAKTQAEKFLKEGADKINKEVIEAKKSIETEIPVIGAMVVNKMLGKGN